MENYPLSSERESGNPTSRQEINRLRADAIYLGKVESDGEGTVRAITLADFLEDYSRNIIGEISGDNDEKYLIPYDAGKKPTIMINGYMLQSVADVDCTVSGDAGTYYIVAIRSDDHTHFTLSSQASPDTGEDHRIIAEIEFDGTSIEWIYNYEGMQYKTQQTVKAAGYIQSDGTIKRNYNISSVSKDGTGTYTISFENDIAKISYAGVIASAVKQSDSWFAVVDNMDETYVTIQIYDESGTAQDCDFTFAAYGDNDVIP